MQEKPLVFELAVSHEKPSSFQAGRSKICPFCDVKNLSNIYQKNEDMIWLKNKFATLRDTVQTVLVESSNHNGDITKYTKSYNRKLFLFSLHCFQKFYYDESYRSVLWYKNFGPVSGGSLIHPHMQIVGLKENNGYKDIRSYNFDGIPVVEKEHVKVNISTHPIMGFTEINVIMADNHDLSLWADWIRASAQYILEKYYNGRCTSYNLFFYPLNSGHGMCCKIVPRFTASPYFVGYKISERNDDITLEQEAKELLTFYLEKLAKDD